MNAESRPPFRRFPASATKHNGSDPASRTSEGLDIVLGALHGGAVGQVVVQDEPADVGRAHLALARVGGVDEQCDLSPVQKTLEAVRLPRLHVDALDVCNPCLLQHVGGACRGKDPVASANKLLCDENHLRLVRAPHPNENTASV